MASAFSTFLTSIGEGVTKILGWVPDIANLYETEPVLLVGIAFFVVGGVTGIFGRLLGKG